MTRESIASLLGSFRPQTPAQTEHLRAMLALLAQVPNPCARSQMHPGHLTASGFVLHPTAPKLLLILHAKLGLWLQPGGHFEPQDQDVMGAAIREVTEETGIVGSQLTVVQPLCDIDVHAIPANPHKGEPAHRHFDLRVLLRAHTHQVQAGSDAKAVQWVPLDQLAQVATDDSVRRTAARSAAGLAVGRVPAVGDTP